MLFEKPQEKRSTFERIAGGLSGFGAGVAGKGVQFQQAEQERRQGLSEERKQAAAEDLRRVQGMLNVGDLNGVKKLATERLGLIKQFGGDGVDTQQLLDLAGKAETDPMAYSLLRSDVGSAVKSAADQGYIDLSNDPSTKSTAAIDTLNELSEIGNLTPEEKAQAARIQLKLATGEEHLSVTDRLFLASQTALIDLNKTKSMSKQAREEDFVDNAFGAVGEITDLNRAFELLETTDTGGWVSLQKKATDFFGTTPANIGELNNLLGANVLAGLSAFTGAISEGERAFLVEMSASIANGKQVNKANLRRLMRIKNNAVRNGTRILERRAKNGDTDAAEILSDLNAQLAQGKKGNNVPAVGGQFENMTDEELDAFIAGGN